MTPLVRYWIDVIDRAARTAAQTAGAMLAASYGGVLDVDWQQIASVSAVAALASILTSMGAKGFGTSLQSPSLVMPSRLVTPPPLPPPGRHRQ